MVSAVLTPLVRAWAVARGVLDQARSSRKVHDRPVPRLGGVAIVGAFFAPLVGLLLVQSGVGTMFYENPRSAAGIFAGGLAIALLGIYDDLKGSGAGKKFAVQFAVAGLMYYLGFRIDRIANPFGPDLELGLLAIPFTLCWFVGVVNAMNLIDGLDGLAGGVALFAVGTTFVVAFNQPNPLMMLFMAAVGGAVLGFLIYNFNPATIFMGDTGSMFLGFVLAASAIQTNQKSTTAVAILTPIVALGFPILDTLLAMGRRAVRGRPLFSADKEHIHHRLVSLGLSHRQAAVSLYAACLALNTVAITLIFANSTQTAVALGILAIVTYVIMRRLGYIQFDQAHYLSDQRRRNRNFRTRLREIAETLKACEAEEHVWDTVKDFLHDVGACWISVSRRVGIDGETWITKHSGAGAGASEHFVFTSDVAKRNGGAASVMLELGWDDGRTEMDRDEEIALEALVEHIADAYGRLALRSSRSSLGERAQEFMANTLVPAPLRHRFRNRHREAKPPTNPARRRLHR